MSDEKVTRHLADLRFPEKGMKTDFLAERNLSDDPDAIAKFVFFLIAENPTFFCSRFPRMFQSEWKLGSIANDDTGWEIERRIEGVLPSTYEDWPEGSEFRISVDASSFRHDPQEAYYDREAFCEIVAVMLEATEERGASRHPEAPAAIADLRDFLSSV